MNSNMYGETCGKEYYRYYGMIREVGDSLRGHDHIRYAFYNNHFYYIKAGYLWKSEDGGENKKILNKVPQISRGEIFVNSTGIYVFDKNTFYIYDLDGNEKEPIRLYYKVESYYICDNRIFIIMHDRENETYYASEINAETGKVNEIYTAGKKIVRKNSRGQIDFTNTVLKFIMGNKKRVVMWIEFWNCYYPDSDYEDEYWGLSGGWYSYDFQTQKLKCINHKEIYPHQILNGDETFFREWRKKFSEMKTWFPIAWFDMKKDRMWIQVDHQKQNQVTWEVRSIGGEPLEISDRERSVWWADANMNEGGRQYFDGEYRFYASAESSELYAYKNDNTVSLNWNDSRNYSATTDFQICGKRLFFVGPGRYYSDEKEYKLAFERPENYVVSWMHPVSLCSSKEEEIMKDYEMGGKQEKKSIDTFQEQMEGKSIENLQIPIKEKCSAAKVSREVYWEEFVKYAFGGEPQNDMNKVGILASKIADRNWYALRLGISKVRIELSFNTKKNTIRTGVFFSDIEIYNKMLSIKGQIMKKFSNTEGRIIWDEKSKTPSICIIKEISNVQEERIEQYKWYAECSCMLANLVKSIM